MDIKDKKIHMVGIGGIGMSALAFVLAGKGLKVSGSDTAASEITSKLIKRGVKVSIGHDSSLVNNQDVVVYSTSIRPDNPELLRAGEKNILTIPRMELLKMVMEEKERSVAVTGTHGKTTTTAMVSVLAETAGLKPTVLIGGESNRFDGNAKLGTGDIIVAEVDESDGRFVSLDPTHTVITNIEMEHAEFYKDESHLLGVFRDFLAKMKEGVSLFYRFEDPNLQKIIKYFKGKGTSFGFLKEADTHAGNVKIGFLNIEFDSTHRGKKLGRFKINIPGVHNVLNALAAISLGMELGIDAEIIRKALSEYSGVRRRFDIIGKVNGATIVEDYAHHPTEIKATITAAASMKPKRIITVFQPHRYTRIKSFYQEFSKSFSGSSEVILTDAYSASENKIEGFGTRMIYELMLKDSSLPVRMLDKDKIAGYLFKKIGEGDVVLILGAGDINKIAHEVLSEAKH